MGAEPIIVGIGASAGGLEAIIQLIAHLKPEVRCAYVILQHLSPSHRSMMVEILARETRLAVKEAGQGDRPQQGVIYVVPANSNALYKDGRLQLVTAPPEVVPKPSVNQFLISLAAEERENAIGVVLSGTGSDGVAGLRAIQAAGGSTLVQLPETAKYDGMPRSAIEAGVVDHILSPQDIALRLPQLLDLPPIDLSEVPPDAFDRLLQRLKEVLHFDFSGYKTGTLMRRIRRREIATGARDLEAYLAWVDSNPRELELLARDILISVTSFFRDREAFEALSNQVSLICAAKPPGQEIRVWVAGCASGEEAYSIAILFAEALGERLTQYRVQIFATDIDDDALNVARRGIYSAAAMSEIPSEQLERHFNAINSSYEVAKHLRDMIVFARHNLVSDPPFLRLDLVSCRNVLIYFDAPLQAKVLKIFHFGLAAEGKLFLGRSESVAQAEQYFLPIDRRDRLFRKTGEAQPMQLSAPVSLLRTPVQRRDRRLDSLLGGLIQHFDLTAVLCDLDGEVLHSVGHTERFLVVSQGSLKVTATDLVVPALRGELLTLLHRLHKTGKVQRGRRRKLGQDWIRLSLEPIADAGGQLVLIIFMPEQAGKEAEDRALAPAADSRKIEDELVATREHLQTLIEEMATANEEMQALNEEAQASNEELQATNEELEAANEELQATNEEMASLNSELTIKATELASLTEEYANLYDALPFPVLVFDNGSHLRRFNGPAMRRFDLRLTAVRQHVSRLRLPQGLDVLGAMLGNALAQGDREEQMVKQDGRTFRLTVTPGSDKAGEVATLLATLVDITDITLAQEQLKLSQERLSTLMEKTTILFSMKDMSGSYLFANQSFLEFFGVEDRNYTGKKDFALLPSAVAAELWRLDLEAVRLMGPVSSEQIIEGPQGRRYLSTTHHLLRDSQGEPTALLLEAEDITTRRLADEQLRITARVFDQAGEAIAVTDAKGLIQTVNPAFTRITGYEIADVVGKPTSLLKSGRHSEDFYAAMWQALNIRGYWQGEIWNKRKNGEIYPEWLTINRVEGTDGEVEHYVAVFSDIGSIKDTQRKVEYLATHDVLTGLPNRTLFHDRLRHALAQARRLKQQVALLFIDLDNFKTINDTLGHDIGDELLKLAAKRLQAVVRDVDTVARLGGDEFTALLNDCEAQSAEQIALRIADEMAASFPISGRTLFVSASIGIAFYPGDGTDSASLIKAADSAMYRAKEQGRNRVEFFKPDLHVRLMKRAAIEGALRQALALNRFRLVFQPKFTMADKPRLQGSEALLRWQDPELGVVSPADFIPVAEASGLILEIDQVVQDILLAQMRDWLALGLDLPPVAFNISPRSIREANFADRLLERVAAFGVPPALLQVEITEGALLESSNHVQSNLARLHQSGINIAIDDFGTGFSSLGYLKRLPLSELKIDKSFVDGLGNEKEDEAIARAVLGLTVALELRSVAEGVETERQLAWLTQHGCNIFQGFLLSRPLEVNAFEDLIAGERQNG
ncbi:MAG TPA: EAL domain-containing protein [Rhodospirillaceae bacterium]|nr:EAL domain-containing protein [Rhodospirillaceae bacterium]